MYKQLGDYLDIANSIKPDVNPETYDRDFGGSVNEPIAAGLDDFATASKQMNFRFKALNEESSKPSPAINSNTINTNDEEDDTSGDELPPDDFDRFLRGYKEYGGSSDDDYKPQDTTPPPVRLDMEDFKDIDWNQSPDNLSKVLGERSRKLLDERTIARDKLVRSKIKSEPESTFSSGTIEQHIANNQIPDAVYDAARDVISDIVKEGIIDQYETGLSNDADFIKNKMIEKIFDDYGDKPSLREKVEKLLVSELKSAHGDISQLVDIYNKKH